VHRAMPPSSRLNDGVGAVRLYENDTPTGALLLERLMPGTSLALHPDDGEMLDIACRLIRRLWRPPVPAHPFQRVRDVAAQWADELPAGHKRHGRPFPDRLVDRAAELARELARRDGNEVVVNRDAHVGNILSAEREPWLLIDPKPLVGDRSFDAGYLADSVGRSARRHSLFGASWAHACVTATTRSAIPIQPC
jgi:streptomycin 6-kinase